MSASSANVSSGMLASRSMRAPSIRRHTSSTRLRYGSPFALAAGLGVGQGSMRSSRSLPRKSSLPKLGFVHSVCRAASATVRASRALGPWVGVDVG